MNTEFMQLGMGYKNNCEFKLIKHWANAQYLGKSVLPLLGAGFSVILE